MGVVEFVGHASLAFESHGCRLVTDPWFESPTVLNSLFQYPPILKERRGILKETDFVHVSHWHADHFCGKSLADYDRNKPFLISKYPSDWFLKLVVNNGFTNICEISPYEFRRFGPFEILTAPHTPFNGTFDSVMVLRMDGKVYVTTNDCTLTPGEWKRLKNIVGEVDGLFLGYSLVGPYPACWSRVELSREENLELYKKRLEARKHQSYLEAGAVAKLVQPNWIVPYACGVRFFHPNQRQFNESFGYPFEFAKVNQIEGKVMVLEPGDRVETFDQRLSRPRHFQYDPDFVNDWADKNVPSEAYPPDQALLPDLKRRFVDWFHIHYSPKQYSGKRAFLFQFILRSERTFDQVSFRIDEKGLRLVEDPHDRNPDVILEYESAAVEWTMIHSAGVGAIHFSNRARIICRCAENDLHAQFFPFLTGMAT